MIRLKLLSTLLMALMFLTIGRAADAAKVVEPISGLYKKNFTQRITTGGKEILRIGRAEIYLSDVAAKNYPKLKAFLTTYNDDNFKRIMKLKDQLQERAVADYNRSSDNFFRYHMIEDVIVRRSDFVALSLLEMSRDYTGGAHGMYGWHGVNVDVQSGKLIGISDVCTKYNDLADAIVMRLKRDYPDAMFYDVSEYVRKALNDGSINWSLEPRGVSFHFNPYEIAPYAVGLMSVTIFFDEQPKLFKSKYTQASDAYCQTLVTDYPTLFKNSIGDRAAASVLSMHETCKITLNKESVSAYLSNPKATYLHMADGRSFLYVDGVIDEGDRNIYVYDLNGTKPILIKELPYTFEHRSGGVDEVTRWIMTNPNTIQFDSNAPVAGSTSHFGAVNDDGSFSFG